jgi:hypothetical protein
MSSAIHHSVDCDTAVGHLSRFEVLPVGDATPRHGPYSSAGELLPEIREHPHRPRRLGIAGYPEGHPLIDSGALADALEDTWEWETEKGEHRTLVEEG